MSAAWIRELELDPVGAEALDHPWEELPFDLMSQRAARSLMRWLRDLGADTIRDALALELPRRDAENLAECVRDYVDDLEMDEDEEDDEDDDDELPPDAPAVDGSDLFPGMALAALGAWATEHEVADMLALGIGQIVEPDVLYRMGVWSSHQRVRDVICAPPRARGAWSGSTRELQDAAIAAVIQVATGTRGWLAAEAQASAHRASPPENAVLKQAWEEIVAARPATRAEVPPRGWSRQVALAFEADPAAIVATLPWVRVEVRLPLEPFALPKLPQAAQRLACIDRVLDLLTDPADAELRAELERILGVPRWRRDLDALVRSTGRPAPDPSEDKNLLCWRVVEDRGQLGLEPARASRTKRGGLATRVATLDAVADLLVDRVDQRVAELLALAEPSHLAGSPPAKPSAVLEALEHLVGHPRVLAPGRGQATPLSVRRGGLALVVRHEGDSARVELTLDGEPLPREVLVQTLARNAVAGRLAVRRGNALVVVSASTEVVGRVAAWLARDARLPPEGHDALLDAVTALSGTLTVEVAPSLRGARLDGDHRPFLLLSWEEPHALTVAARTRRVPELPPEVPGEGSITSFVRRGDARWCVERDLDAEPARVREALLPLGLPDRASQGPFSWRLADRGEALAAIERLQRHLTAFQVQWAGEVPRVRPPITAASLHLTVSQGHDWFGIGGGVRLESGAVDLAALLRTIEDGHDYVQVGAGTFARVDEALRAGLVPLAAGVDDARVSMLLAPAVRALEAAGAEIEAPVAWLEVLDRLEEARTLEAPVPAALRAELRDYQLVGFRWLAALAHWAPGACLADDMGLGKTVQAIALLLRRAELGPALVVAPASVLFNWERELARFAPDLAVEVHHGAERGQARPGPGTVLLTTYGVLLRDAEGLAAIRFATAVLDEAQAIKNPAARRSTAAFGLQADFRLALSGTPVENRVAELWSLFRFVAPGLLGSEGRFRDRFVEPIEVRHDTGRRAALAATIRPFVLRRTKEDVERDLPPLTESVLRVSLSPEERTLYDAARIRAVARLERTSAPQRRFLVLQELLLLRQLACHPRLADPGSEVASSKLRHLRRLVGDLRVSGHRALVYSQFVKHLALVREAFDADGVRYRYLDGSLSLSARRAEVDAFQSGDGDVFLVSREAGGVGLNLTAANYVVHLDPWWNPAKEDQATDRAHRIGQSKPVTVYRLVSEGTIEERILELHAEKRELADALLAGTDGGARASTAELLALLGG